MSIRRLTKLQILDIDNFNGNWTKTVYLQTLKLENTNFSNSYPHASYGQNQQSSSMRLSLLTSNAFLFQCFLHLRSKADMLSLNKQDSSSQGLPSKFKNRLLECFGYTTAHGYGRVAAATESQLRRWFWLLACAAAFGVFSYQLHDLTVQFLSRPLKTRTQIQHEQVRLL